MCRANSNDDTVTKVTLELDLELDLLTKLDLNIVRSQDHQNFNLEPPNFYLISDGNK